MGEDEMRGLILKLLEKVSAIEANQTTHHQATITDLTKHSSTLYGNGAPGLTGTVQQLKDAEERRSKREWLLFSLVVGLIVQALWKAVV